MIFKHISPNFPRVWPKNILPKNTLSLDNCPFIHSFNYLTFSEQVLEIQGWAQEKKSWFLRHSQLNSFTQNVVRGTPAIESPEGGCFRKYRFPGHCTENFLFGKSGVEPGI